jgi:hypothetical protein
VLAGIQMLLLWSDWLSRTTSTLYLPP